MSDEEKYTFPGNEIDVEWDGRLCIHVAECGKSTGELFVGGRKPWCNPDLASQEEVIDVVKRCPTGALTFSVRHGNTGEEAAEENTLSVSCDGPYYLGGDLDIENVQTDMPGVRFRAALCRCGHTKNKPFCDNSHEAANFKDYGAIGDKGEGIQSKSGKLNVTSVKDGPLILNGNLTMYSGNGRMAWQGTHVALCRCGASKNKPFCDGSHTSMGFKS